MTILKTWRRHGRNLAKTGFNKIKDVTRRWLADVSTKRQAESISFDILNTLNPIDMAPSEDEVRDKKSCQKESDVDSATCTSKQ